MSAPARWRWGEPVAPLVEAVASGAVLGLPTESSYALAVDPSNQRAVESVFRLKGRPADRPLPVVIGDYDQLRTLGAELEPAHEAVMRRLWPESLTVVLPIRQPVAASAGRRSLALRIPRHSRLRHLLQTLGTGLTATSANRSGAAPVVEPRGLAALLDGTPSWLVDDGPLPGGEPSTIVRPEGARWHVLRCGALPVERLQDVVVPLGGRVVGIDGAEPGVRG